MSPATTRKANKAKLLVRLNRELDDYVEQNRPPAHAATIEERATKHLRCRLAIIEKSRRIGLISADYAAWKSCEVVWVKKNIVDEGGCGWGPLHDAPDVLVWVWFELMMKGPMGGVFNWADPYDIVVEKIETAGVTAAEFLENCYEC